MEPLFRTEAAKRAKVREPHQGGLYVMPDIHSMDPRYLNWTEIINDDLNKTAAANVDEEGVSDHRAVPGDFNGIRTVAGYSMSPLTYPARSNAETRLKYKLVDDFVSKRHRMIWDELIELMFSTRLPAKLRMAKISSTGFPFFEKDPIFKIESTTSNLLNAPEICNRILQGDLEGLYADRDFVIAAYLGTRAGVDTIKKEDTGYKPKDREVYGWNYAMNGDQADIIIADKTVRRFDTVIPDHFATRMRTVYGLSASANMMISAFMAGIRNYLYRYEYTWEHTTTAAILAKIQRFQYFVGFDVKGFDTTVPNFMMSSLADKWTHGFHPGMRTLFEHAFHAPYYAPPVEKGADGKWMGHPFQPSSFNLNYGLGSGIACNPDVGKAVMTFTYLCVLDDFFGDVVETGLDRILRGEHPDYAMLNCGDDCVLLTNKEEFKTFVLDAWGRDTQLSPYFKLEKEEAISFLGNVFYRDYNGNISIAPNLQSYIYNWWVPERGVNSKMRLYWPTGFFERQKYYSLAPSFSAVNDVVVKRFRQVFGTSPEALAIIGQEKIKTIPIRPQSEEDRLVLEDPSRAHYRVRPDQLSPEIQELISCVVDEDVVTTFIHSIS